jgi:hypothetical protein
MAYMLLVYFSSARYTFPNVPLPSTIINLKSSSLTGVDFLEATKTDILKSLWSSEVTEDGPLSLFASPLEFSKVNS